MALVLHVSGVADYRRFGRGTGSRTFGGLTSAGRSDDRFE